MRLVSYNILDGGTGRADPLAEIILAQRSDIVVLLEAQDAVVVQRIASRAKMDFIRAGDDEQSAAILSRWAIAQTIDHAALRPGISKSLVEARVTSPDGIDWRLGAVHLHAGAFERDESIRELELEIVLHTFESYRRHQLPHLLVGDFNSNAPYQNIDPERCKPKTRKAWQENGEVVPRRAVQRLLDAGYVDSLQVFDAKAGETGATFTTQHPGQRVDYIFVFGIDPARIKSAWIEMDRLAKYASDHFPVGVEIHELA